MRNACFAMRIISLMHYKFKIFPLRITHYALRIVN